MASIARDVGSSSTNRSSDIKFPTENTKENSSTRTIIKMSNIVDKQNCHVSGPDSQ